MRHVGVRTGNRIGILYGLRRLGSNRKYIVGALCAGVVICIGSMCVMNHTNWDGMCADDVCSNDHGFRRIINRVYIFCSTMYGHTDGEPVSSLARGLAIGLMVFSALCAFTVFLSENSMNLPPPSTTTTPAPLQPSLNFRAPSAAPPAHRSLRQKAARPVA